MKKHITLLTLSATLAGTATAATHILDGADYTITTSGDYYTSTLGANLVTIERNITANVSSYQLTVNDFYLKTGASITITAGVLDADGRTSFIIYRNGSLATSITSKNDFGYIGNTANHSLPAELSHLDFGDIHAFSNVTLANVRIYSNKQNIYFDNVTLSGNNLGAQFNYAATANRLTLDLGTYANAPIDFTLLGNGATTTVTESLTLDIDFGDLTSIDNVSIALNGLELADGLDASDISIDGYEITRGEFVASGSGYSFTGSLKLIPEPSTASLSLLALAGLLARRRRKAA